MRDANSAPAYACMYPGLCETARKHGYALAIHGSVITDLDLVAIPWTEDAAEPEIVVQALKEHVNALTAVPVGCYEECERKPHGRLAWNLFMECGAKVDLSVIPKKTTKE